MTVFTFAPATREQVKARVALQGPAGSGKTKSALLMAETLAAGGTIGLVDTERGSALRYAPVPGRSDLGGHTFLHLPMESYDPRDLAKAVQAAADAGIACLIVDSWSHFYAGKGGLLELVDGFGKKAGAAGTFGGWKEATPIEQTVLDTLLNFPGHLIVTLRTKNDYSLEGGKVTHHGVKVIQREGTEYEFDIIASMVDGTATFTKTRCPALTGAVYRHPGAEVAEVILEWLGEGVDPVQQILKDLLADGLTYQAALELHGRAKNRNVLGNGLLHPVTGIATTLGALIREYGEAAKPKAAPQPSIPVQPAPAPVEQVAPAPAQQQRGDSRPGPASAPQLKKMGATFGDLGIKDRAERLRATSLIVGRPVPSANDLDVREASLLIDALSRFNAETIGAHLDQLEDAAVKAIEAQQQPAA